MKFQNQQTGNAFRVISFAVMLGLLSGCATFDRIIGYEPQCRHCGESVYYNNHTNHRPNTPHLSDPPPSASRRYNEQIVEENEPWRQNKNKDSSNTAFDNSQNERTDTQRRRNSSDNDIANKTENDAELLMQRLADLERRITEEKVEAERTQRKVDSLNDVLKRVNEENTTLRQNLSHIEEKTKLQHESEMATLRSIEQVVEQLDQRKTAYVGSPPPFSP